MVKNKDGVSNCHTQRMWIRRKSHMLLKGQLGIIFFCTLGCGIKRLKYLLFEESHA